MRAFIAVSVLIHQTKINYIFDYIYSPAVFKYNVLLNDQKQLLISLATSHNARKHFRSLYEKLPPGDILLSQSSSNRVSFRSRFSGDVTQRSP